MQTLDKQIVRAFPPFVSGITLRPKTTQVIIHHTATADVSASQLHRSAQQRNRRGIGYHFVIRKSGTVEEGLHIDSIGAHAGGANTASIGIALTGNFDNAAPNLLQLSILVELLRFYIFPKYGILDLLRHSDVSPTACPGALFPWDDFMQRMIEPILFINGRRGPHIVIRNGRAFTKQTVGDETAEIPLREMSRLLGGQIRWDDVNKFVQITLDL